MGLAIVQDYLRAGGTEKQSLMLLKAWTEAGEAACLVQFRPGGDLASLADRWSLSRQVLQPFDSHLNFWAPGFNRAIEALDLEGILLMGRNANRKGYGLKKRNAGMRVVATMRTGRSLPASYSRTLWHADAVVTNSRWGAERLRGLGIEPRILEVIPNGRTLEWSPGEQALLREQTRKRFLLSEDTRVLLQVASLIPGKNFADLIEIVAAIDERRLPWELWCVGSGPLQRSVVQMAKQMQIRERVRFFGFQEDIKPYLASADLMITTSREESSPNALIEAQASGLPVIAYDTAGVGETLLPGRSGYLVPPGDQHGFLKNLEALMGDAPKREAMSLEARQSARRFPDAAEQGNRYLELLRG